MVPIIAVEYQYFSFQIELNAFKYSYSRLKIPVNITHSFTQLNCLKYCKVTQTI